ncbi:MAG: redoxin domain-containing protein [Saprospiraceae bacterium]
MKKLVLLLLILSSSLFAAKAPDFTVTDYNNKVHILYTDYLNKEKVVVLKFFFVDCPPCNAIAPLVQPAYNRWGGGTGRVQFFELTTQSDNNAYVKTYANKYGITFPGIGTDGGASTVVAPYKTSTFGTWYGTPTFAVIAPNGEVNFNVPFGNNNTVQLDSAIAQALRIPSGSGGGGSKCNDSFQIKVYNPYSSIFTPRPVTYDLYNSSNPKYDLINGKYNCEFFYPSIRDYYVVGFEEPIANVPALDGISTQDIVLIQKYILSIKPLNNLQLAVADVNNNQVVSSSDISELRKLILGLTTTLKVNKSFTWTNNPKGFDGKISKTAKVISLIGKEVNNEFGFGKYGDVSGAEKIGFFAPQERSSCAKIFNINIKKYSDYYQYEISTAEPLDILAFQFMLNGNFTSSYDFSVIPTLIGFSENSFRVNKSIDGDLRCLWDNPNLDLTHINSGETLLKFKSKEFIQISKSKNIVQELVFGDFSTCGIDYSIKLSSPKKVNVNYSSGALLIESDAHIIKSTVYSLTGELKMNNLNTVNSSFVSFTLPSDFNQSGIYYVQTQLEDGSVEINKVFILR